MKYLKKLKQLKELVIGNMNMFYYIKNFPLFLWLKWVIRTICLKKQFPTLSIGAYSQAKACTFGHRNIIYNNTVLVDSTFGDYTYIGGNVKIQYADIGKYCSIAEGVKIGLGIHPLNLKSTHPAFYSPQSRWKDEIIPDIPENLTEYKRIVIGDDVWIGTNAIIMDGVVIGDHAVIAACAFVNKDVPAYAIVGGIPAKIIKYRSHHETY